MINSYIARIYGSHRPVQMNNKQNGFFIDTERQVEETKSISFCRHEPVLSSPEQFMLNVLRKSARWELRRRIIGHELLQRLEQDLLLWGLAEDRPRYPHLLLVHEPPVQHALVHAIAQDLQRVANVHDQRLGN